MTKEEIDPVHIEHRGVTKYRRFLKFCHGEICEKCPVHDARSCKLAWAQMPYGEGGAK